MADVPPTEPAETRQVNKLAVALAARDAMRSYRRGKPIAFQANFRPRLPRG